VTRAQLSKVFDKVADKANWKNPINATAYLSDEEKEMLARRSRSSQAPWRNSSGAVSATAIPVSRLCRWLLQDHRGLIHVVPDQTTLTAWTMAFVVFLDHRRHRSNQLKPCEAAPMAAMNKSLARSNKSSDGGQATKSDDRPRQCSTSTGATQQVSTMSTQIIVMEPS